jgi:CheY-like chemotaxis protein
MSINIHRPGTLGGTSDTDFSRCRILLLDPFIGTRRLISDMLIRDMRVERVRAATSISDAMEKLNDEKPAGGGFNILFTDWSGQVDAIRLLGVLRATDSPYRFLPVVVMSAINSLDSVREARDAGMNEFMLKPFSAAVLQSRLRSITQVPRLYVEAAPFFGPDRRRRRDGYGGAERRDHSNYRYADRRSKLLPPPAGERRQGRPGFVGNERRDEVRR